MESLRKELSPIRMRNYGRILQDIVAYACTISDEMERRAMTLYIAQCMRQKNMVWNKDQESGLARIKEDIARLSDGRLDCEFEEFNRLVWNSGNMNQQRKKKK